MDSYRKTDYYHPLHAFITDSKPTTADALNQQTDATPPNKAKSNIKAKPGRKNSLDHFRMTDALLKLAEAAGVSIENPCAVYAQKKARSGLRLSEVRRIDRIGVWAVTHMTNPIGFHLEIYPSVCHELLCNLLNNLPKWLDRFGKQHSMAGYSPKVPFIYKVEWSRDGRAHIHLYCIADGWDKHTIERLRRLLSERMNSIVRLIPRKPVFDGNEYFVLDGSTGEIIKRGLTRKKPYWHFLKSEFDDWRERTTYAAKNHTRMDIGKFRSFHCSRVPLADDAKRETQKVASISDPKNGHKKNDT